MNLINKNKSWKFDNFSLSKKVIKRALVFAKILGDNGFEIFLTNRDSIQFEK